MAARLDIHAQMNLESVPPNPSPERPPLAPYDPPDPAPQAAAWDRALRVIFMERTIQEGDVAATKPRSWRVNRRGRAATKGARRAVAPGGKAPRPH
jgi:hypothetical protein